MDSKLLDIFKMGHIMVVRKPEPDGYVGNQIEKMQLRKGFCTEKSRYTHVEVLGGGNYSVRVAPPKTSIIEIDKTYTGRFVTVVKYKGDKYAQKRYKVAFWASSNCNLPYDWLGVLRFKFKRLLGRLLDHQEKAYFCSENTLWALQKEYPNALNIQPYECMPAHFLGEQFEVVWEGII